MARIKLCAALFRMPGLEGVYEEVRAQLNEHMNMLAEYDKHLNMSTEIHVVCDSMINTTAHLCRYNARYNSKRHLPVITGRYI